MSALLAQFPVELQPDMQADSAENRWCSVLQCVSYTVRCRLLHRAARFGHPAVVQALVAAGADCRITNKVITEYIPSTTTKIISVYLVKYNFQFGMSPLHHAAVEGGPAVLVALLEAGADPNIEDRAGRLPLHWAAARGHAAAARTLLQAGARPAGQDKDGFTPLHRCCQEEPPAKGEKEEESEEERQARLDRAKAEVAELLLEHGADTACRERQGHQAVLQQPLTHFWNG